jgi:hypothetical protein
MKLTIRALCAVFSMCAASALGALDFDFGGIIGNLSTPSFSQLYTNPLFDMDQRNSVALWADLHAGSDFSVLAQGSYTFTLEMPYLFNPDILRMDWRILPALELTLGRFLISDFTGLVLSHTLDGLQIGLDVPFASVRAAVGYSGFLLKPTSTILMSRSDSADLLDGTVFFAPPRLVEKLEVIVPQLPLRQQLSISVLLQHDLRWGTTVIQSGEQQQSVAGFAGGKVWSQYYTLGLSGPVVSPLYWDGFFCFSTGQILSYISDAASATGFSYQYEQILAYLAGVTLRLYLGGPMSPLLELRGIWSSGDADNTTFLEGNTAGASTLFVPISVRTFGLAFMPKLGNLVVIDAGYSFKPFTAGRTIFNNFMIKLQSFTFLRPTTGAVSMPVLDPASTVLYLGTENDLVLDFRPTSDLGIAVSTGIFFPSGAFAGLAAEPEFAGRLELSFSF